MIRRSLAAIFVLALGGPVFAAPPRPAPHRAVRVQQSRPLRRPIVKPLATREILVLKLARGKKGLVVLAKTRKKLKKKKVLPRFRGPFEVRLYTKTLLRDVVTFSFPLTLPAGERTRNNMGLDKALLPGIQAKATVRIPWLPDLTHLILVDKQRGTFTRHVLKAGAKTKGKAALGTLPGPKRTDSLGSSKLFGAPASKKSANPPRSKRRKEPTSKPTSKTKTRQ